VKKEKVETTCERFHFFLCLPIIGNFWKTPIPHFSLPLSQLNSTKLRAFAAANRETDSKVNLSVDFKLFKIVRCSLSLIPKMAMCYICNIVQKI